MATINSFPNNSDEYIGAEEVMRWLHGRTSGVYGADGNAAVSAVQNSMAVSVAKGIGWLTDADGNGIVWWSESATQLTIDAAEPTGTLNRIDRIIVRWYIGDYSDKPEIIVLKGSNASSPTPPAINTDARYKEISLARVRIPAGTTQITNTLITDERFDPSVCGIVTESITADTSMISAQYDDAVEELERAISQAWGGEISDGSISFEKLTTALRSRITNIETDIEDKVLYLTSVVCSAMTGDFATVSNADITEEHVVAECVFATPSAITANVSWTTGNGTLKLNGTCSSATTCSLVLIKKDN